MGFLIEYNNSRYLLVELMGSAAKHRILPAIRVERKDQNTGMTLIWLGLTTTYIYIYIYIYHLIITFLTSIYMDNDMKILAGKKYIRTCFVH